MRPKLREALDRGRERWRRARQRAGLVMEDARRRWRTVRKWVGVRAKRWYQIAERWEVRAAPPLLLLAGWAAVTAGVAEAFGAGRVVWPIGVGVLALGLYGFRPLWITLWFGLAALRKTKREHPEDI